MDPTGEHILVVEDEPDLRSLLCELLAIQGYRPHGVADGEAAVKHVAAARPDAVVLDVMLPGMDGFEVCQRIKFHRETNLIPILMLTALSDRAARRSGLRVGADRYLTKPFEPADLFRELRRTLEHRRELLAGGKTRRAVEIHMDSDGSLREGLNDLLSELFLFTPLSDAEVGRIRYAVLEMTQNAIEWGNRKRKDLSVHIAYEVTDELVKFVITDQGEGFDPRCLPHAACEHDPVAHMEIREKLGLREGGFGILISRGMVDEVRYNQTGNQVTLIKRFGNTAPAAGGNGQGEGGNREAPMTKPQ